jgi:hypothetical protein
MIKKFESYNKDFLLVDYNMNRKMINFLIKEIDKYPYVKDTYEMYAKLDINHPRTDHILIFNKEKMKVKDYTHILLINYQILVQIYE